MEGEENGPLDAWLSASSEAKIVNDRLRSLIHVSSSLQR